MNIEYAQNVYHDSRQSPFLILFQSLPNLLTPHGTTVSTWNLPHTSSPSSAFYFSLRQGLLDEDAQDRLAELTDGFYHHNLTLQRGIAQQHVVCVRVTGELLRNKTET